MLTGARARVRRRLHRAIAFAFAVFTVCALGGCGGESGGVPSGVNGTLIQGVLQGELQFGYDSNQNATEFMPSVDAVTVTFEGADYEGNNIVANFTPVKGNAIGHAFPTWRSVASYKPNGDVCTDLDVQNGVNCQSRFWADLSITGSLRQVETGDTMEDYTFVEDNFTFGQIKSKLAPGPIEGGYLYDTGQVALLRSGSRFDTVLNCYAGAADGKPVSVQIITCQSSVTPCGIITINHVYANSYTHYVNPPNRK